MSALINDGGPAFPVPGLQHDEAFNGMTLRDYFAAKAMAILMDTNNMKHVERDARCCYEVADAMLKARSAT